MLHLFLTLSHLGWMGAFPCFPAMFSEGGNFHDFWFAYQGPVVESINSLTNSLRGQLVKCFTAL